MPVPREEICVRSMTGETVLLEFRLTDDLIKHLIEKLQELHPDLFPEGERLHMLFYGRPLNDIMTLGDCTFGGGEDLPDFVYVIPQAMTYEDMMTVQRQRRKAVQRTFVSAVEHKAKLPWRRSRLMLIGRGRGGKTSTVKSLMGMPLDAQQPSTVGVANQNIEVSLRLAADWEVQCRGNETLEAMAKLVAKARSEGGYKQIMEQVAAEEQAQAPSSAPQPQPPAAGASAAHSRPATSQQTGASSKTALMRQEVRNHVEKVATDLDFDLDLNMVSGGEERLTFSVWDCGGQAVFHSLIHLFFSRCSVYLCVFSMSDVERAETREEALKETGFWLNSAVLQAHGAPVLLVGTHGDVVRGMERWGRIEDWLMQSFGPQIKESVEPYHHDDGHDLWFFPVNNKDPKSDAVKKLRAAIERAAKEDKLRYIDREVPVAWRQVLDSLHGVGSSTKLKYATLDHVKQLAGAHDVPEWQVQGMLELFHELGALLYFTARPELQKIVVLQPQWLMDAICRVVCDFRVPGHEKDLHRGLPDFERLKSSGEATEALLSAAWSDYDKGEKAGELCKFFRGIMLQLALLCPIQERTWLVPGLLPDSTGEVRRARDEKWVTFWIDCTAQFLPPCFFERVMCLCAELCHEQAGQINMAPACKLTSTYAVLSLSGHVFHMDVDNDSIRVAVADRSSSPGGEGGPALVLRYITRFAKQVKTAFFKGLRFEVRLGGGDRVGRADAPTRQEVQEARQQLRLHAKGLFRPRGSKREFAVESFHVWFRDAGDLNKLAPSQWLRLQEDWPFVKRWHDAKRGTDRQYSDAQQSALYKYLQDAGNWGIGWGALERVHAEASKLPAHVDATTGASTRYGAMSMWHIVQMLVKPVCASHGAPLTLVYNDWGVHAVEEFVTHCWREPFAEFMASLHQVYKNRVQKPALFICAFSLYQGTAADVGAQLDCRIPDAPFVKALEVSRQFVVVRNGQEDIYTRAWCLVEFIYAKKLGLYDKHVSITGPKQTGGAPTSCLDVEASVPDDKSRIIDFLIQEATVAELDRQIQEFRDFDAGFEQYLAGTSAQPS